MRLLDLCCGGGGTAMGYHQAGFEIIGIDIYPQPKFPFEFYLADALTFPLNEYDLIHASPPCQAYTKASMQWRKKGKSYPDLIARIRERLIKTGTDYVIENVLGSPLRKPIRLNGSTFGLLVHRPRLFECSFPIQQPLIPLTKKLTKMGRPIKEGDIIQPVGHFSNVSYAQKQMEIDWLGQKELSQAIPPAYTKFIGLQWMKMVANQ